MKIRINKKRFKKNQTSLIQEKLLKGKCPACSVGSLRAINVGNNDKEVYLWCNNCNCSIDSDGGCIN